MGKARKKTKASRKIARAGAATATAGQRPVALRKTHPVMKLAISNGARLDHATFEVAEVQNPFGEVIIHGQIRHHKAVRRVPRFETLYRSKVIDRSVFVCLEWYAGRLALAQSGLIKCSLDVSGSGGGSAFSHVPTTQAAMEARSDVDWARGFIPDDDLCAVFDGVMGSIQSTGDDTFETIGAQVYPGLCLDRAKRRASSAFKIAANHLLLGIGARVLVGFADAA